MRKFFSVLVKRNRYDEVMKAMNNSSEYILALAGNFSEKADGHLVCFQNTESGCTETRTYSTQAVNIQGRTRKGMCAVHFQFKLIWNVTEITSLSYSYRCKFSGVKWCIKISQWPVGKV